MTEKKTANPNLVAYCGLYCGACSRYRHDKCPGCHDNTKATWCAVRTCSIERNYTSCAECTDYPNPRNCAKFNNAISRIFGFVFRSDRAACIAQIKAIGIPGHAEKMANIGRHSLKR